MVHPGADEIARLERVAFEMREVVDESSFLVDNALDLHSSFRVNRIPAAALERGLVIEAARRAGAAEGFSPQDVGTGLDLITYEGDRERKYRVKSGKLSKDGEYVFLCAPNSGLLRTDSGSFWIEDQWLLGYLVADDHTIAEVIAAEIVGSHGENPVHLTLGPIITLSAPPAPDGFISSDDVLPGFENDDDAEAGDAGVA